MDVLVALIPTDTLTQVLLLALVFLAAYAAAVTLWPVFIAARLADGVTKTLSAVQETSPHELIERAAASVHGRERKRPVVPATRVSQCLRRYEQAWRGAAIVDLPQAIASTLVPETYLGPAAVLPDGFSRGFMRAMPGVLTTGGIFGTFIGLTLGLKLLAVKFTGSGALPTPQLMSEGILGLMRGMATAFYTSVAGIALALVWTALDRTLSKKLEVACRSLVQAVEALLPTLSMEATRRHHLQMSAEQTSVLKTLSTDIGLRVSEGLDESIRAHLAPQISQMQSVVEQVAQLTGESQVDGMERMVAKFSDVLGERLTDQFDNLAETIEQMCAFQSQAKSHMQELLAQVEELVASQQLVLETAGRSAELFQSSLGGLKEIHEHVDAATTNLAEVAGQTAELQARVQGVHEAMGHSAQGLIDTSESAAAALDKLQVVMTDEIAVLSQLGERIESGVESVEARIDTAMKSFTDDCQRGVATTFGEFDKQLSTLSHALSGTIAETDDTVRELLASVAQVREALMEQTQGKALVEAVEAIGAADESPELNTPAPAAE